MTLGDGPDVGLADRVKSNGVGVGAGVRVGVDALPRKMPDSTAFAPPVRVIRNVTFPLIFHTTYVP